jgi:hypothetical protein
MSGNHAQRRRHAKALQRSNEKLAKNRCWNDLNTLYQNCAQALVQHLMISELAKDRELLGFLSDPRTVVANVQSLKADLQQLDAELRQIQAQHGAKTGGAQDEAEMMQAFTISEQYYLFMERHNGVVLPTVFHILEHFHEAEQRRDAARAQLQQQVTTAMAQDPLDNTPIDVELKPAREPGTPALVDVSQLPPASSLQ